MTTLFSLALEQHVPIAHRCSLTYHYFMVERDDEQATPLSLSPKRLGQVNDFHLPQRKGFKCKWRHGMSSKIHSRVTLTSQLANSELPQCGHEATTGTTSLHTSGSVLCQPQQSSRYVAAVQHMHHASLSIAYGRSASYWKRHASRYNPLLHGIRHHLVNTLRSTIAPTCDFTPRQLCHPCCRSVSHASKLDVLVGM
eukprot:31127-Amphidinium_carterae.1